MHWVISAATVGTVLLVSSCSDSSPRPRVFALQFQTQSADVYFALPECQGSADMYCHASRPASQQMTGELDVPNDTLTLTIGTARYVAVDSLAFRADSSVVTFFGNKSTCNLLHLQVKESDGALHGTWTELLDCHGLSQAGSVAGTLQ